MEDLRVKMKDKSPQLMFIMVDFVLSGSRSASSKTGGVRFTEEPAAAAAAHSHVHFDEKLHDSVVMVIPKSNGNFLVK
ncbi:hypothetical protein cypCar_00021298, partial [Cyprinus carpio]